jgi:hypothetical protein
LLKTISLSNCIAFCNGLEYFVDGSGNPRLISNELNNGTPGIYDVYDTDGNLITRNFINTSTSHSGDGIAFDGTNFFVSNLLQGTISTYTSSGTFIRTQTITGFPSGYNPLVEDLSFDYLQVLPGIPEPGTFVTLGAGMLGLLLAVKRRQRS